MPASRTKSIKILFITHYAELYGANRSLLNLIEGLNNYNIEPLILVRTLGDITLELEKRAIEYIHIPFPLWMYNRKIAILKLPFFIIESIFSLIKQLFYLRKNNISPNIIYSNSSVFCAGALLSMVLGRPHIWHVREFGKEDYDLNFYLGKKGARFFFNKANAIIAISRSIKEAVLPRVLPRTYIIYNGIISKEKLISARKQIAISEEFSFAIVGLISPSKNQWEAIRAFKLFHDSFPSSKLYIAGSGDEKYVAYLKNECVKLGISENVFFLGFINDPFTLYSKINVLLICSRNEGMGRVTVEAMACGVPVIGYNKAGTAEVIDHLITGILYQGGFNDLANAMIQIKKSPDLYNSLSNNSLNKVTSNYTIETYADKVFEVINSVV